MDIYKIVILSKITRINQMDSQGFLDIEKSDILSEIFTK